MLDQIQRSQARGLLEARESFSRTKQVKNQAAAGTLARRKERKVREKKSRTAPTATPTVRVLEEAGLKGG